jgi:Cof subfamily protein (haloacid dehalogenase superfamily)
MNRESKRPMEIRALCTDIDGTLLDVNRALSDRTIVAIGKLREKIPVILASSRMPSAMRHLQQELGILKHPLICYNGGYVIHYISDNEHPKVIHSVQIPLPICASILELSLGTSIHVSLYVEDQWYAPGIDEWALREARITKVEPTIKPGLEVIEMWEARGIGAHKVMCMGGATEIKAMELELRRLFQQEIHVYHSKSTYLEIAPKTISKASALELLLREIYKISLSEAIAFGDNYNDIELLQSVGLGIAVGNAREEVKAVAREVTANSKEHGVALSIDHYFNNE